MMDIPRTQNYNCCNANSRRDLTICIVCTNFFTMIPTIINVRNFKREMKIIGLFFVFLDKIC